MRAGNYFIDPAKYLKKTHDRSSGSEKGKVIYSLLQIFGAVLFLPGVQEI
jgi:hypothetical protein